MYFQYSYCNQQYKQTGGKMIIRVYDLKLHRWNRMTFVQLKMREKKQRIEQIFEHSAPGEVKCLEANKVKL